MESRFRNVVSALILVLGLGTTPAWAGNGVFDFMDPCVKATDNFRTNRVSMLQKMDIAIADADKTAPIAEYRAAWMKAAHQKLRQPFDETVAPTLKEFGVTDMEGAYGLWFNKQIASAGAENVDKWVASSFHQELKEVLLEQQKQSVEQLQASQKELEGSCKMDVGNQALRGTLTLIMAPVGLVSRDWDNLKKQSTVGGQILAVVVPGADLKDIIQYGPAGGKNSVINEGGRAIADIFGW